MVKKIIGGVLAGLGTLGGIVYGSNWFETVTGGWVGLDKNGNVIPASHYAIPALIAIAVAIVGIVLLVMGIKQGKKNKDQ